MKDLCQRSIQNNQDLSNLIREFVELNPLSNETTLLIHELYNNMYDLNYVKHFARTNFTNLHDMQDFFYTFIRITGLKKSMNSDIRSYYRVIEMVWDGINGWQW